MHVLTNFVTSEVLRFGYPAIFLLMARPVMEQALGANVDLICAALFKPELVQEIPHTQPPQVVILSDASASMTTRDIATENKTVETRAEWLNANCPPDRWKPLAGKGKVTAASFAAPRKRVPHTSRQP